MAVTFDDVKNYYFDLYVFGDVLVGLVGEAKANHCKGFCDTFCNLYLTDDDLALMDKEYLDPDIAPSDAPTDTLNPGFRFLSMKHSSEITRIAKETGVYRAAAPTFCTPVFGELSPSWSGTIHTTLECLFQRISKIEHVSSGIRWSDSYCGDISRSAISDAIRIAYPEIRPLFAKRYEHLPQLFGEFWACLEKERAWVTLEMGRDGKIVIPEGDAFRLEPYTELQYTTARTFVSAHPNATWAEIRKHFDKECVSIGQNLFSPLLERLRAEGVYKRPGMDNKRRTSARKK